MRRAYGNIDISTRIDEPKRVYSTCVSEMLSIAHDAHRMGNRLLLAETLLEIVRLSLRVPDLVTLKKSLFLLGNVFSLHREIQQSITCFMKLRDVAEEEEDSVCTMNAYKSLG